MLNNLSANFTKAIVLCQVERVNETMLNVLYSSMSAHPMHIINELLQENQEVKVLRMKY